MSILDKILTNVKVNEVTGCWEWQRGKDKDGYGKITIKRKHMRVHRVVWEAVNNKELGDLFCLHKCDNPSCVNPDHLFSGTNIDNMKDMYRKNRGPTGDKNGTHTHPERVARGDRSGARLHPETRARGDRSGARLHPEKYKWTPSHKLRMHPELIKRGSKLSMAKLTEDLVREIRCKYSLGGTSCLKLGAEYGVNQSCIHKMLTRQTWKHVP